MSRLIIISGGPGSGKTTLLESLKCCGYKTFEEVPRLLIKKNIKEENGLLPWINLPEFAKLCFSEMVEQKSNNNETAFVDRAIGDIIAYLHIGGFSGEKYRTDAVKGYDRSVFMLCPHRDIYVQDEVRPHSFEEALAIHEEILNVYSSLGFRIIEIPFGEVKDQISIIERELEL